MVHIVDNWYIDADDSNYILIEWAGKKQVNKKTGAESMQGAKYRYYNKIDTALEQLVAIAAKRAWLRGEITDVKLNAASAAASAAARAAASAASDAASAAASAAWDAEYKWQVAEITRMLEGVND